MQEGQLHHDELVGCDAKSMHTFHERAFRTLGVDRPGR